MEANKIKDVPKIGEEGFFDLIDTNKDGLLTEDEVISTLYNSGIPVSKKLVNRIFDECDLDQNRIITRDEFMAFYKKQDEKLKSIFNLVDHNGDGHLSIEEFQRALKNFDPSIKDEEINLLVDRMDADKSRTISYQEFMFYYYLIPINNIRAAFDLIVRESIDLGEAMSVPTELPKGENPMITLVAGGVAGAFSRTITAPLDRLKTVMQADNTGTRIFSAFKRIFREDGFKGLFKGNGTNVIKIMPETAVKMMTYDRIKEVMCKNPHKPTTVERLISGAFAGFTAQTLIYPLEITKTRLALSKGEYHGIADCLRKISRQEGFRAIYKGWSASMMGIVPYAAIDLTILNILKETYVTKIGQEPTTLAILGCGAMSGMIGQVATYPMALVRTRLQNQRAGQHQYNGLVDCFAKTAKKEGVKGLYRGLLANLAKGVPAVSLSYAIFDKTKALLSPPKGKN